MTIEEVKKRCTECGELKDLNLFHRNRLKKDGRATKCAKCLNRAGRQDATRESKIRMAKNKIVCNREGKQIFKKDCLPGCNDACQGCESEQVGNTKAGGETLTSEESKDSILDGVYGSSSAIAVDEGHCEI